MNPEPRFEPTAATMIKVHAFVEKKLKEVGLLPSQMTVQLMSEIQVAHFPGIRTRRLMQLWLDKAKQKNRVVELELGKGGGSRKQGEHNVMRQHTGLGIRALNPATKDKKSQLAVVFAAVKVELERWRMSGQYVDKEDLIIELEIRLKRKIVELEAKRQNGGLSVEEVKLLAASKRRLLSHQNHPKNRIWSGDQLQRLFKAEKIYALFFLSTDPLQYVKKSKYRHAKSNIQKVSTGITYASNG